MLGTSTAEYIWIRTWIFFFDNIAPVGVFYCIILIINSTLPPAFHLVRCPIFIELWLVAEAVFFILVFLPYRFHLQRSAIHPDPGSRADRGELVRRCNETITDPEQYLSRWFLGAEKEDIRRENVKEFFRWAFFNAAQVEEEYDEEIEGFVQQLEKQLGREIPPGTGSAKGLRLTLGNVDCLRRSLLWYLCISVVDTAMYLTMLYNGFHFYRTSTADFLMIFPFRPLTLLSGHRSPAKHLTYWYRPHRSKSRLPLLFIHGIGVGLYPYTTFLRDLNSASRDTQIGIIALEIMPVSSRICQAALDRDVMVREVAAIIKHHGWSKFVLASHSYGSIITTHLLKSPLTAPLIGPVVFVDPVSFLLHLPDVAYNFTARQPALANEHYLWYFGSKDMGVAHTLARRFFWSENIVWKEDLVMDGESKRNVTVVLGGQDTIVNSKAVKDYLTTSSSKGPHSAVSTMNGNGNKTTVNGTMSHARMVRHDLGCDEQLWTGAGLEVLWFEQLDHGQVFDSRKMRKPILEVIRVYSAQG